MPDLRFLEKDPTKGYRNTNLLIPKPHVNQSAVKEALTFVIGEEDVVEEDTGRVLATRPKVVRLWDETEHHLIAPRAFITTKDLAEFGVEWIEERPESIRVNLPDNIVPRDTSQEEALAIMAKLGGGTVNLACGRGKSIIAIKYAVTKQEPALIVVNSSALADQWLRKIKQFVGDIPVGHIQGDVCRWKGCAFTVATVQTLASRKETWTPEFRKYFGVIFYDEGHHMSAPHFVKSADLFYGERFSLTATAYRTDGLESIYQYHLGPIIYQDLNQDLIPDTVFHVTNWQVTQKQDQNARDVKGSVNHGKLCIMLGHVGWRNDLILRNLETDMAEGRQVLVLTHSVEHTRTLRDLIAARYDWNVGLVNGPDTKPLDRIPILLESNPVVGTFQIAREALDKEELDTLHICTPFGNPNDLQQAWGRIQRKKAGKNDPRVRVYEDGIAPAPVRGETRPRKIDTCVRQCRKLRKYLKVRDYPTRKINEETQ